MSETQKHITVQATYVTECVHRGIITLVYVPTVHQRADIFTKPLGGQVFSPTPGRTHVRRSRETVLLLRVGGDSGSFTQALTASGSFVIVIIVSGSFAHVSADQATRPMSHQDERAQRSPLDSPAGQALPSSAESDVLLARYASQSRSPTRRAASAPVGQVTVDLTRPPDLCPSAQRECRDHLPSVPTATV